jgi:hypothetical protein
MLRASASGVRIFVKIRIAKYETNPNFKMQMTETESDVIVPILIQENSRL